MPKNALRIQTRSVLLACRVCCGLRRISYARLVHASILGILRPVLPLLDNSLYQHYPTPSHDVQANEAKKKVSLDNVGGRTTYSDSSPLAHDDVLRWRRLVVMCNLRKEKHELC